MHILRVSFVVAGLLGLAHGAQAGSAPAAACAAAGAAEPTADLVLGHFRGGRIIRTADFTPQIVWKDEYACFTSRRSCQIWQRDMDVAYRNVEGDRTCLPLR